MRALRVLKRFITANKLTRLNRVCYLQFFDVFLDNRESSFRFYDFIVSAILVYFVFYMYQLL